MEAYLHTDYQQIFEISKEQLNVYDEDLFDFLIEWKSETTHIQSITSGSTGNPKTIELSKSSMLVSAKATNGYFNLDDSSIKDLQNKKDINLNLIDEIKSSIHDNEIELNSVEQRISIEFDLDINKCKADKDFFNESSLDSSN